LHHKQQHHQLLVLIPQALQADQATLYILLQAQVL